MHVIVCGGRSTHLTPADLRWLNALRREHGITHVSHGAAPGVDTTAGLWAAMQGLIVSAFPADWEAHGNRLTRHHEMARASCSGINAASSPAGSVS